MLNVLNILAGLMFTEIPGDDPPADPPEGLDTPPEDGKTVPITDLKKANAEAAKWRKQLRTVEATVEKMTKAQEKATKDAEIAKLDDIKQAQAKTDQANEALTEAQASLKSVSSKLDANTRSQAVYRAANAAGFLNPEDAIKLLDESKIEVVDSMVDNDIINGLIDNLAESRPNLILVEAAASGSGPTNPPSETSPPGPKLSNSKQAEQMRQTLEAGKKDGTISGHAIVMMRREIRRLDSGAAKQAERGNTEARIKKKTGG